MHSTGRLAHTKRHVAVAHCVETVTRWHATHGPLTAWDVWRLQCRVHPDHETLSLVDVFCALDAAVSRGQLIRCGAFVTTPVCPLSCVDLACRGRATVRKRRRAARIVRWLQYIPSVRAIFLTGRVAAGRADYSSDIDVLVVARWGMIWTTRLLIGSILHVFGLRRHGRYIRDRMCLNHFATDRTLSLVTRTAYDAAEVVHALPLAGDATIMSAFRCTNAWTQRILPHAGMPCEGGEEESFRILMRHSCRAMRRNASVVERVARALQLLKMRRGSVAQSTNGLIVANDERMLFFPHAKGKRICYCVES